MEKFVVQNDLTEEIKKAEGGYDLLRGVRDKIMQNEDLKVAMLSGCNIETFFDERTRMLTIRTKEKVSILRDQKTGQVIHVYIKDETKK